MAACSSGRSSAANRSSPRFGAPTRFRNRQYRIGLDLFRGRAGGMFNYPNRRKAGEARYRGLRVLIQVMEAELQVVRGRWSTFDLPRAGKNLRNQMIRLFRSKSSALETRHPSVRAAEPTLSILASSLFSEQRPSGREIQQAEHRPDAWPFPPRPTG